MTAIEVFDDCEVFSSEAPTDRYGPGTIRFYKKR